MLVGAEAEMCGLGASSKLNADRDFLDYLRDLSHAKAQAWLDEHFDMAGRESSADIVIHLSALGRRRLPVA